MELLQATSVGIDKVVRDTGALDEVLTHQATAERSSSGAVQMSRDGSSAGWLSSEGKVDVVKTKLIHINGIY